MASKTRPDPLRVKSQRILDRTLKEDDIELTRAMVEADTFDDIEESQPQPPAQTRAIGADDRADGGNATQLFEADEPPAREKAETAAAELRATRVLADEPLSATSAELPEDGRVSDSLPEISLAPLDVSTLPKLDDEYRILKKFAKGGQGILAKALDKRFNRMVVIKSLRPEHLKKEKIRRIFIEEVQITAQLVHPAIVSVYSLLRDEKDGLHLAMELIQGENLEEYIERIKHSYKKGFYTQWDFSTRLRETIGIFRKILEPIAYAHGRKVIHCDLKPENVMLGRYGEVFVLDWGLAKKVRENGIVASHAGATNEDAPPPKPKLDGTPRFIPPEAYAGVPRDERADIFALGLILFELVTLQRGYDGHSIKEVIQQIRNGERTPMQHRFGLRIPKDLAAIIDKATEYNPADRYQSVQELDEDLQAYLNDDEVAAKPDNFLGYLYRRLRQHSKMVLLLLLAGWIGFLLIMLKDIRYQHSKTQDDLIAEKKKVEKLQQETDARRYEELAVLLDGVTDVSGNVVSSRMSTLTNALSAIALQAREYLSQAELPETEGALPIYLDEEVHDRGAVFCPAFNRELGMDFCSLQEYGGDTQESRAEIIQRLLPVSHMLQHIVLFSGYPLLKPTTGTTMEDLKSKYLRNAAPVFQVSIALENPHVQLTYPATDAFAKGYDHAARSWYQEAKERAEKEIFTPFWGRPYNDSTTGFYTIYCARPFRNPETKQFLGVVAFKMSFETFKRMVARASAGEEDTPLPR